MFYGLAQMRGVRSDAADAALRERDAPSAQMIEALEQTVRDDRLECIELELAGFGRKAHRHVVADHFECDLIDDSRNDGIHFAGHDARARLHRRQIDLAETCARA